MEIATMLTGTQGLLAGLGRILIGFVLVYIIRKSPFNVLGLLLTIAGLGATALTVYNTYIAEGEASSSAGA